MEALATSTKGVVPPTQFPQQGPAKNSCMVNSFSSALHHFGLQQQEAGQINHDGELLQPTTQHICHFINVVHGHIGKLGHHLQKVKCGAHDPINDTTSLPVIGILHTKGHSDSELNHCVGCLDNLTFEPSLPHPVPQTEFSLNVICGGKCDCLSKSWRLTKCS